ncbi:hypothetical protein BDU57DRAFT_120891 [Ampelomyces quisqualis]|uniref:Uncharacterized protein n=1 Tax=Ampelomyces quisqualis TaxID=50730 RepID=A0A6A5QTQ4_AMPQU|nr:hypothetical protein BDU57DRAFT_120891 [Ampelomyces quisqualis]
MISLLLTLFFSACNALDLPTADSTSAGYCPVYEYNVARYDNLPFWEGAYNPVPPFYYGLSYSTFQVDRDDGFIRAISGNQATMAFGGSGNISIPDSASKQTFDLHRFYYACVAGIPQPECAVSMWGFKPDGSIVRRVLTFPSLWSGIYPWEFYMNATEFGAEWQGLKSVGFSIARRDNGGDMYGGLLLDDVEYSITTAC